MRSYCSPNNQEIYDRTKTCYTLNQLRIIAKKYNDYHVDKIKVYVPKSELLKTLHDKLKVEEFNWHLLPFLTKIDLDITDSFKPQKPISWSKNDREWLNTSDIMTVMEQYEDKYHSFKFLGVHPLDFSHEYLPNKCVSPIMCNFSVAKMLKQKKSQCGAIFNLDYHYQPGSHWVAMYIGLSPSMKNFGCYYIDSTATPAPSEVIKFMQLVKQQISQQYAGNISKKFVMKQNKKQFQFKNTECGMFSMFFLLQFLKKKTFKDIINSKINDDKVHRLRDHYYVPTLKYV